MNKWSVLHYSQVFMIFCQMTACFSKPTGTKYRNMERKYKKVPKDFYIWICINLGPGSLWTRHLHTLNSSKQKNKTLHKCHCLGIIVSRNKEITTRWWMGMLFSSEQRKHRLTHFRPICEGDVWRMLGKKERRRHCEKEMREREENSYDFNWTALISSFNWKL